MTSGLALGCRFTRPRFDSWRVVVIAMMATSLHGCQFSGNQNIAVLPRKHSVTTEHFTVLSDVKLTNEHPLLADLVQLRKDVEATLDLPASDRDVVLYVFKDEEAYKNYFAIHFPGLAFRRAYFIGTPGQLGVYTYWGEKIQEDLRHEYTHGVLHAAFGHVQLWVDEGIAEYFEVASPSPDRIHRDSVSGLSAAMANGWTPDLPRLEKLERVPEMHQIDYQESWAWVHMLLHHSAESRQVLIDYLKSAQTPEEQPTLHARIATLFPDGNTQLTQHVSGLNTTGSVTISDARE